MLHRENAVAFIGGYFDACSLWRTYMPYLAIKNAEFHFFPKTVAWDILATRDAIVIQRACLDKQLDFIRQARAMGLKIVYDLDDDVWEVPKKNPAHGILMKLRDGFGTCIVETDIVTVSTTHLAKIVYRNVPNMINVHTGREIPVMVCENRLMQGACCKPLPPSDDLVIGWAGSSSHIEDIEILEKAIADVSKSNPEVVFEFRGCDIPEGNPLRKAANYRWKMWLPVSEYLSRFPTWGWSIALCPVTDHRFNRSKSGIKMYEAAYCKIPCLASDIQPYREFCEKDPELEWLLCSFPFQWSQKLYELVNDPARRQYLGEKMNSVLNTYYTLDGRAEQWECVFSYLS